MPGVYYCKVCPKLGSPILSLNKMYATLCGLLQTRTHARLFLKNGGGTLLQWYFAIEAGGRWYLNAELVERPHASIKYKSHEVEHL